MNVLMPILFLILGFGLTVKRMTPRLWTVLAFLIGLFIAYRWRKH